ncbi:MAG: DUF2845 domain-containing protein [Cellvibrio sp.]|nr:DUF2845 domain-containing protein [Cellvibrio sp.]
MKKYLTVFGLISSLCLLSHVTQADSLRCEGRLVDPGDTKADVTGICGSPEITDSYCEPTTRSTVDSTGKETIIESCDPVDIWSYKAESGGLWKHVYFSKGKVTDIRNGERVN